MISTPPPSSPRRGYSSRASLVAGLLLFLVSFGAHRGQAQVNATFNAATDIPVIAASYNATGQSVNITLNFAPPTGTNLTVVHTTGGSFINGQFTNLANGSTINLTYQGTMYAFIAWYYGGAGGDLVLLWPTTGLVGWGQNTDNQLYPVMTFPPPANPAEQFEPTPVDLSGSSGGQNLTTKTFVQIAHGTNHTLALSTEGLVYAWGNNSFGQLGDPNSTGAPGPVNTTAASVLSGKTVVAIAAGADHSLALCSDGTVAAWGGDQDGELGDGGASAFQNYPVLVSTASGTSALSGKSVFAISAGAYLSIALCTDGTVATWGNNLNGELGTGATGNHSAVPLAVTTGGASALSGKTVTAIAASGNVASGTFGNFCLALCSDGTLAAWGYNGLGQLGNGTTNNSSTPVAVSTVFGVSAIAAKSVTAVAAGATDSLALCSDGTLAGWGFNQYGAVGDGTTTQRNVPTLVNVASGTSALFGKAVTAIGAGPGYSVALCSDGTLASWGYNSDGELGNNDGTGNPLSSPTLVDEQSPSSGLMGVTATGLSLGSAGDGFIVIAGVPATPSSTPPTATTTPATSITGATAVLNAMVNPNGLPTTGFFEYGTTVSYGGMANFTPSPITGSTSQLVSASITGLAPGTTYHFQVVAGNTGAPVTGGDLTFTTASSGGAAPAVVTKAASSIAATTAVLNGTVNPNHLTTTAQFQYGLTASYGSTASITLNPNNGATAQTVKASLTGLAPGSTYHFRVTASSSAGQSNGADLTFTTAAPSGTAPAVVTSPASSITTTGAVLNGTVNPNKLTTSAQFEYGLTNSYGSTASVTLSPSNGSTAQPVSASITGLTPGATYHFRVAAYSSAGSSNGADMTFTAFGGPPQVVANAATNVNPTTAVLNATVNPNSIATTAAFQYGPTAAYGATAGVNLSPNNGTTAQAVAASISGLIPATTYHFTVAAQSSAGSVSGSDLTFTTPPAPAVATFNGPNDIPITASSYTATGNTITIALNFAPAAGTNLTVIRNTGTSFINGAFSNLANGATVNLTYGGFTYPFVAWYYGGAGGDLVLLWPSTTLAAWGANGTHQLGDGTTTERNAPAAVQAGALAGKTIVAVAHGNDFSLALTTEGLVYAWGNNAEGELGDPASSGVAPAPVNTASGTSALFGKTVVAIRAGYQHGLALCSDGTLAAWGADNLGQLGDNMPAASESYPVAVNTTSGTSALAGKSVFSISTGDASNVAQCSDGTLLAWGDNTNGQIGDTTNTQRNVPVLVNTASGTSALFGKTVAFVAGGSAHYLALCTDGTIAGWGYDISGQLGDNTAVATRPAPVTVNAVNGVSALFGKTVVGLAASAYSSFALCSDGTVLSWGYNTDGELGDTTTTQRNAAVAVSTLAGSALAGKSVVSISAGSDYCIALCSDGSLVDWGGNTEGDLGTNGAAGVPQATPVSVNTAAGVSALNGQNIVGLALNGDAAVHNVAIVTTPPAAPLAVTAAATNIAQTTATLNGTVNPNGFATTAYFQYGASTAYGAKVNVALSPNNGSAAQPVSTGIVGLIPGTIYHFRLVASSTQGVSVGPDLTFSISPNLTFNSPLDIPITASSYDGTGNALNLTLNFAPTPGTNLTVVHNTGSAFIAGPFSNVANGSGVNLTYNGVTYSFIAWYYGGSTGRDLVLLWPITGLAGWGANNDGQLGDDTAAQRAAPVAVDQNGVLSGLTIVQVCRGASHTLALATNGLVYAWGSNASGQLGDGTTTTRFAPVAVNAGSGSALLGKTVVAIAAGQLHSLALCSDGTIAGWGDDSAGELGNSDSTLTQQSIPAPVSAGAGSALQGKSAAFVAAAGTQSFAVCSDGTVAAWGNNDFGQLGDNDATLTNQIAPVSVYAAASVSALYRKVVTAVAAGDSHTLALCSDGTVAAWGSNASGQLGNGDMTGAQQILPSAVITSLGALSGQTVTAIAAGANHSVALTSNGSMAAWGLNVNGQLGNNDATGASQFAPVAVNAMSQVSALFGKTVSGIAAGAAHSLALCQDGTLAAWGLNANGELGNDDASGAAQYAPVSVDATRGQSVLAAGPSSSLAAGSDAVHSLVIYGSVPPPTTDNTSAGGNAVSLASNTSPTAVGVNPITNKAYVLGSNGANNYVTVLDLANGVYSNLSLTFQPAALAINAESNRIFITAAGEIDVIDGDSDLVSAEIASGSNDTIIAVNPVTNTFYCGNPTAGTVDVINGATNTLTITLSISSPKALAVNAVTNEVYVVSQNGTCSVINGSTNAVSSPINLGSSVTPTAIGVNAATNIAYVSDNSTTPGSVIMIDGPSKTVTGSVQVGNDPAALAVDPRSNQVYVVNSSDGTVSFLYQVGSATMAATTTVGGTPTSIAFNPSNQLVYAMDVTGQNLNVLDSATRQVVAINVNGHPTTGALAVNPLSNQALVANSDGTLSVIDQPLVQSGVNLGANAQVVAGAVNPLTNQIYVATSTSGGGAASQSTIQIVDDISGAVTPLFTGQYAAAMAVNPVTNKIYVVNDSALAQQTGLTVIDGVTKAVQMIAAPILPDPNAAAPIAINPVTNRIYIANGNGSSVTVVDGATNTFTNIPAGLIPFAVAVNPVTNQIYAANAEDNTVTIINGSTNATSTVQTGTSPVAVAVNPATNMIYVANQNSNNVTIINGGNNQVSTIPVGNAPEAIAVNTLTNVIYVGNALDHSVSVVDGATNTVTPLLLQSGSGSGAPGSRPTISLVIDQSNNTIFVVDSFEGTLTQIDGATNTLTTLVGTESLITASGGVLVNPSTHNVYIPTTGFGSSGAASFGPIPSAATGVNSVVTAVGAVTTNSSSINNQIAAGPVSLSLSAATTYAPYSAPVQQIYYQLDSMAGPWSAGSATGAAANAVFTSLAPGFHTLYAFAADGQEASASIDSLGAGNGNSLIPGGIAAYSFLATPGAFSFATGSAFVHGTDVGATLQVTRNFTTPATVSYQTVDDTAVAGTNYSATQGVLSFPAGVTTQSVTIPLLNPTGSGGVTSFLVQLSNPSGFNVVNSPASARVSILNNNAAYTDALLSSPTATAPIGSTPLANASVTVNLSYDVGAGDGQWRIFGELQWRDGGTTATGFVSGNYTIEFKPINGYQTPAYQPLIITPANESGTPVAPILAEYISGGDQPATGSLSAVLTPSVGAWRRQGSVVWHPSGYVEQSLNIGSYILEFQPVTGFVTPGNVEVFVQAGLTSTANIVYLLPYYSSSNNPSTLVTNPNISDPTNPAYLPPNYTPPFQFTGQIQTDVGLGTGFVPLDRIVVTAAHVVFDDVTLSYVTGIRWYFQRERNSYEEPPQIPTGIYALSGYAAQRGIDNTPDISSTASQQLDTAVLYFMEPTARGGSSGYLASNQPTNTWLTGSANKILFGYPADIVDPSTVGQLYATPVTTAAFASYGGSLFETTAITSYGGNSGGPLCVQYKGVYYPAAVYLGGSDESDVRAIDSQVIDLMNNGEDTANGGPNHVGGGVIVVNAGLSGNTAIALGSISVNILPADAVSGNARWQMVGNSTTRTSGSSASGLSPGNYQVTFLAPTGVAGYATPTPSTVSATVTAGATTYVTAVYTPNQAPAITSPKAAAADPGRVFVYQLAATLQATSFNATHLPAGLTFDPTTNVIHGIPVNSGTTPIVTTVDLTATNSFGTGTSTVVITTPPAGALTVATVGSGSVPKKLRGSSVQAVGSTVSILATPAAGAIFVNWTDLDTQQVVSTTPLFTVSSMPLVLNLQATFIQNPFTGATYTGLLEGATVAESGIVRLTLQPTGSFSAVFTLGQNSAPLKSSFPVPSTTTNPPQFTSNLNAAGTIYNLTLTLGSDGAITGSLQNPGASTLNFSATCPVKAPIPAAIAGLAGSYGAALVIPSSTTSPATPLPAGNGTVGITVTKTGSIRIAGNLGDGLKVSSGGTLDANGAYPLYLYSPLSKTSGIEIALGEVSAVLGAKPVQFTGTLNWFRNPSGTDPAYPQGFDTRLMLTGDPGQSLSPLGSTAHLTFAGADLTAPVTQDLTISKAGTATPKSLSNGLFTFKYSASTGLFSGTFMAVGTKPRPFSGAFLPSQTEGYGYFQEANGVSGSVLLQTGP